MREKEENWKRKCNQDWKNIHREDRDRDWERDLEKMLACRPKATAEPDEGVRIHEDAIFYSLFDFFQTC